MSTSTHYNTCSNACLNILGKRKLGGTASFQGQRLTASIVHECAAISDDMQVVIKVAEHDLSPNTLSALHFAIAAVCFSPLAVKGLRDPALRLAALELGIWLFGES